MYEEQLVNAILVSKKNLFRYFTIVDIMIDNDSSYRVRKEAMEAFIETDRGFLLKTDGFGFEGCKTMEKMLVELYSKHKSNREMRRKIAIVLLKFKQRKNELTDAKQNGIKKPVIVPRNRGTNRTARLLKYS